MRCEMYGFEYQTRDGEWHRHPAEHTDVPNAIAHAKKVCAFWRIVDEDGRVVETGGQR